ERLLQDAAARAPGRRVLVIRPPVACGPRNYANMYALIRQIDSGRFLQVGRGQNIERLVYVENLVAATIHAWRQQPALAWGVVNVVDKPDLTSRQIAEIL